LIRPVDFDHVAEVLIGIFGVVLEDQLNLVVVFISEFPFPDMEDTKGITFPFVRFPIFFFVSFEKSVEEFFAGIFIFEFDLDDFSRRITDTVRDDPFIKTMPVINNHLFEEVGIFDVGIVCDIAAQNKSSHFDGDVFCGNSGGEEEKKGKKGDGVGKQNVHKRLLQ
jgi:hypothetical protein